MTILTVKLTISILFLGLVLVAVFTMFEVFGRKEKSFDTDKLTRIHRVAGILFFITVLVLGGLGATYIALTKGELSPRASFHVMLAHGVLFLLLFKLAIVKRYRQFYPRLPTVGMLIAFLALGTMASSSGYYILSRGFGPKTSGQETALREDKGQAPNALNGKELFLAQCSRCHDVDSDSTSGAPGMKGILKRPVLPSTGRPATAGNIILQLKEPYGRMPAFPDLTQEETANLIAYMKEL
jgi:hypothetical protein